MSSGDYFTPGVTRPRREADHPADVLNGEAIPPLTHTQCLITFLTVNATTEQRQEFLRQGACRGTSTATSGAFSALQCSLGRYKKTGAAPARSVKHRSLDH